MVAVAVVAAACGQASTSDQAERDAQGRIVGAGPVGTQRLQQGDCFVSNGDVDVVVVDGLPCRDPHDGQVVTVIEEMAGGDEWPGVETLRAQARDLCLSALPSEAVLPGLGLAAFVPDEGSWGEGDRRVVCFVESNTGDRLTGDVFDGTFTTA